MGSTSSDGRNRLLAAEVARRGRMAEPLPDDWEVPEELRGEPGIVRNRYEETFYANEVPFESWIRKHAEFREHLHREAMPYVEQTYPDYRTKLMASLDDGGLEPSQGTPTGDDLTEIIRGEALQLGCTMVGFRPYQAKYTFKEERDNVHIRRNVVALGLEQDHERTQEIPSVPSEMAAVEAYIPLVEAALGVAQVIRLHGYRAQVTIKTMVVQPYFVDAGLGQMGANGQLLTPFAGSRIRLLVVLTDAPVAYDGPLDYGVPELCRRCQICVDRCPGRALTSREIWWRGVRKFKTVSRRCAPMLSRYDNCGICMKVCPVQRYGYREVMDHFRETGQVLGKGSDELEGYLLSDKGYFPAGRLPTFSQDELSTPGIE